MNPISLLNWMLLSTVLLGAWWLCYRLLLRGERSFVYNRVFLVLGPVLAAGLPLLPLGWPAGWFGGANALSGVASVLLPAVVVGARHTSPAAGVDWPFWALAIYASGAVILLAQLGWELGCLWRSTRRLAREQCAGYTLVRTHGQLPTSSFGKVVFWDETLPLSPAEAGQVLRHELAHVQQGHTHDRLLLELLRVALWFNPFVHLCGRALALTHEYLADEAALRHAAALAPAFSPTHSYTHLLARQVATRLGFSLPLAHTFSHSQTLRRIAMIHRTSPIRRWKQWLALPLVALSFLTVACERDSLADHMPPPPPPTVQDATPPPPPPAPDVAPPPPPEKVYTFVEKMPQLPGGGGNKAIVEAIQRNVIYPQSALANHTEGKVFASFYIDSEGKVRDAKIVKGLDPAIDAAVIAAVQKLPRFTPGQQDGKAVAVSFTVPVQFAL